MVNVDERADAGDPRNDSWYRRCLSAQKQLRWWVSLPCLLHRAHGELQGAKGIFELGCVGRAEGDRAALDLGKA